MGKGKRNKRIHDQAIDELEEEVRKNYQIILKNVPYTSPNSSDTAGELDLLGICGQSWDIYEVKSNDGYDTAVKQLERARKILSDCGNIRTFYYSAKDKKIKQVHGYSKD
jgi:hypothetical protein